MTREGWESRSKADAMSAVTKINGQKDLLVRFDKEHWLVRTKKPSCIEYKVNVLGRKGDCKTTTTILSERPCP